MQTVFEDNCQARDCNLKGCVFVLVVSLKSRRVFSNNSNYIFSILIVDSESIQRKIFTSFWRW